MKEIKDHSARQGYREGLGQEQLNFQEEVC